MSKPNETETKDEPTIKVGSVVELRSGGPDMTVTTMNLRRDGDGSPMVGVAWFHEDNEGDFHDVRTAMFPPDALILLEE